MFFCGISGEPPQDPVVSSKSGHVYERRLILKYINDNGTDPLTGEKLEESDLLTIKASEFFLTTFSCSVRCWYSIVLNHACQTQKLPLHDHLLQLPSPPCCTCFKMSGMR